MKAMIWTAVLFICVHGLIFSFSILTMAVFAFFFTLFLIERISDYRRHTEARRYSRFGSQFGGNFKDSSGGVYYGDGFRGVNGTFGGGFR